MQTAPISGLQSTQQTQATSGDVLLQIMNAAKADPNGPFGKWVASHDKELKALFSQYLSGNGSSGSQFTAAQFPQAYSSDQISPEVQQNPNGLLNEPAIHSSARMAPKITEGSDGSAPTSRESISPNMIADDPSGDDPVDDGGDSWNAGSDGGDGGSVGQDDPVDSGDDPTTQGSSDDGSGSQPVQTSGDGNPTEGTTSSTLNEAPLAGLPDDGFTSAAEYQTLENLQANVDAAEAAALANPKDPDLAQAAQNARMALQLEQTRASQDAQMAAQHAMDALKNSVLH
jgi:hypothetical protein